MIKFDYIISWSIGLAICVTIGYLGYQKKVENDQRYLSFEEKIQIKENEFNRQMGALEAKVASYEKKDVKHKEELSKLSQRMDKLDGILSVIKPHFQDVEGFNEVLKDTQQKHSSLERNDKIYAEKIEILENRVAHLPESHAWKLKNQSISKSFDSVKRLLDVVVLMMEHINKGSPEGNKLDLSPRIAALKNLQKIDYSVDPEPVNADIDFLPH